MFMDGTKVVCPREFLMLLHNECKTIMYLGEQNDLHEFLCVMIDKLNACITEAMPAMAPPSPRSTNDLYAIQQEKMDHAWLAHHQREYSPLVPMMHSQIISQIICQCGAVHHNYEVQMNFMLPIVEESLQGCLDAYFKEEHVSHEWTCDKCRKKGSNNIRTVRVWRHPKILILALKRFDDNMNKISKRVEVPQRIDFKKHSIPACPSYVLRSVAFHQGSVMGGHYYAICNDGKDWFAIDDDTVMRVNDPHLGEGYVYFYEAVRPAPRS